MTWGQLEEAMVLFKENESIKWALGDRAGLSRCLGNQALIQRASGQMEEAIGLIQESESM